MRWTAAGYVLPLMLVSVVQTCDDGGDNVEPPVIENVEYPDVVVGDSSDVDGYLYFTDADAGVQKAVLESVECPVTWSCPTWTIDLRTVDPGIPYETEGIFGFSIPCDNPTSDDVSFAYSWTLIDSGDNVSEPYTFGYTCLGTGTGTSPVITDVQFPEEVQGNGTVNTGVLSFEDLNAGVRYATLEPVICPASFDCETVNYDLLETDPDFTTYYWGTIGFGLRCNNVTNETTYLEYAWTLEDIEGHQSDPYYFGFTCFGAGGREAEGRSITATALAGN